MAFNTVAPIPQHTQVPAKLLYRVRLKDKHHIREVIVSARDLDRAMKVGQKYCEENHYLFLKVEDMVVASE